MTSSQSSSCLALLFIVVGAFALLGLTSCQSPALGIGVPIEELPAEEGVPIPGLAASEDENL